MTLCPPPGCLPFLDLVHLPVIIFHTCGYPVRQPALGSSLVLEEKTKLRVAKGQVLCPASGTSSSNKARPVTLNPFLLPLVMKGLGLPGLTGKGRWLEASLH